MKSGVLIKYGDIAVGAKEEFVPNSIDKAYFVNFNQLKQNISFPNFTNPCELYSTVLDGSNLPIPLSAESANLGWWSEQISGNDGRFSEPIVLISTAVNLFTSIGLTLTFDTINNVYANSLNIKWYRDDELISNKDFAPNSSVYFCQNTVDFYNKIEITFYSINMPKNRLKIHSIDYGYGAEFKGDELKSVKIIQEIDPLSTEIAINPCDFELTSKRDFEFSFQDRQPVETYFNGILRAKTFIKSFKRKSKTQWTIQSEDYIGIMENIAFYGGIYENKNAIELITEIFTVAKIPFTIDETFADEVVSGYIPYTTCREALMQVAFAIGAVVDTSNRDDVYVYALSEELTQTIPLKRIMQGQNFAEETRLTAFELTSHKYTAVEDVITLYKAEESEAGENIFVRFSQPVHSLDIQNGAIIEGNVNGTNYAVINADKNCVLIGKKYEHIETTKTKKNTRVLITDTENIISIKDATLVSNNNVDILLEKCFDYFSNNRKINSKIIENKHVAFENIKYGTKKYGTFKYGEKQPKVFYDKSVNVGDKIEIKAEYLGNIVGRVIKQTFNLNGGIIIKDTIMR